jgi:hypothetical protein
MYEPCGAMQLGGSLMLTLTIPIWFEVIVVLPLHPSRITAGAAAKEVRSKIPGKKLREPRATEVTTSS